MLGHGNDAYYVLVAVNALLGASSSSSNPVVAAEIQVNDTDEKFEHRDEGIRSEDKENLHCIECRDTVSGKTWFRCPICKATWVDARFGVMLHALHAKKSGDSTAEQQNKLFRDMG